MNTLHDHLMRALCAIKQGADAVKIMTKFRAKNVYVDWCLSRSPIRILVEQEMTRTQTTPESSLSPEETQAFMDRFWAIFLPRDCSVRAAYRMAVRRNHHRGPGLSHVTATVARINPDYIRLMRAYMPRNSDDVVMIDEFKITPETTIINVGIAK